MKFPLILAVVLAYSCSANAQFAEFNDQGITFGHVHLVVADIELYKELWAELFDAEVVEKQGYSAVWLSDALIFFRNAEPTAPSVKTALDHFGIRVRNVEETLSKWRALGYEVDFETTDAGPHASAGITLPGGVTLELQEDPGQSATASMGHLHFATPIPDELMTWYSARFGAIARVADGNGNAADIPGSSLRFEESHAVRLPTEGTAIDHIGFEVREWDAFIAVLEENGIEFGFGPAYIESLDLWVAFFEDPSGVLVEVSHGLDKFRVSKPD